MGKTSRTGDGKVSKPLIGIALFALVTGAFIGGIIVAGPPIPPEPQVQPVAYVPEPAHTRPSVHAYMIGDSIVSGASIGMPDRLLGPQMAQRMDWRCTRDGFGGSGYIAKGNQPDNGAAVDKAFQTRLPGILKAKPDVVVVAGGRNDMYFGTAEVAAAAEKFLTDIRNGLPSAKIVTIGGWRWNTSTDLRWVDTQTEISAALRAATEKVGGVYIDPVTDLATIDDSNGETMIAEDLFHPTVEGHALLGRDLAYELVERGLPRGPEIWKPKGLLTGEYEDVSNVYFEKPRGTQKPETQETVVAHPAPDTFSAFSR